MGSIADYLSENCSIFIGLDARFCLAGETLITVLGKERIYKKPVSEVKTGEYVLTYNGKNMIYSKVTKNIVDKGPKTFFTFKIRDKKANIKSISATENHSMIIFKKDNKEPQFKYSIQVKVGDLVRTTEGIGEVIEIKREIMENSFRLGVEHGTVLANDILVGAFYYKEKDGNLKIIQNILATTKIPFENKN